MPEILKFSSYSPESDAMKAGDAAPRSTLDKPLEELTEEDISQLTREDCRKYLKEKGMRRPSWNKSQAIQQVLSLKTLFESKPDSGDAGQKPAKPSHIGSLKETSTTVVEERQATPPDFTPPDLEEIPIPAVNEKKHSVNGDRLVFPGTFGFRPPIAGKRQVFRDDPSSIFPSTGTTNEMVAAQLTIFYSGVVNVYDAVPEEKARTIMLLAGNPNFLPHIPADGAPAIRRLPISFPIGWVRPGSVSPPSTAIAPALQTVVPKTRKASVQRFLEKRKDRGRSKGMHGQKRGTSFGDAFLNQQLRGSKSDLTPNPRSSVSGTYTTNGPRPPHTPTRCSSAESQATLSLSKNLNEDDVQDA